MSQATDQQPRIKDQELRSSVGSRDGKGNGKAQWATVTTPVKVGANDSNHAHNLPTPSRAPDLLRTGHFTTTTSSTSESQSSGISGPTSDEEEAYTAALAESGLTSNGNTVAAADDTNTISMMRRRVLPPGAGHKRTLSINTPAPIQRSDENKPSPKRHRPKHTTTRPARPHGKFRDLVFTRTFSTFDRQNADAANSPFHGFFTLFWMAVFLFVLKIGAENWRRTGSPLGTNEIMRVMFGRDLVLLLVADGVMCGATGVSWVLQQAVKRGWINWDREGWVLQNVWQMVFIGAVIGLPTLRDWPWTHTVFFVMHGLVMLMKQHSYAFYNGYLSSAYKKRARLLAKLKRLEEAVVSPTPPRSPSTSWPAKAMGRKPSLPVPGDTRAATQHLAKAPSADKYKERRRSMSLSGGRIPDIDGLAAAAGDQEEDPEVVDRVLGWEVDALTDELRGKSTTDARAYPNNLTLLNHYEFIVLPTVVYELEYPRSDSINWWYAAEKMAACFGIIFVMITISQAFVYPVVMDALLMKENGVPLAERFHRFPWMLSDLIFPFMMEYLLAWYLIWETILNLVAEITYFADRSFYDAWWNCVSWDQFARDWNRPVHNFLLRHVYHSSISAMCVDKHTATLITFFLSACVHELVMWCIFRKLRGYLLVLQMCQLPLVRLSRTKWLRHRATLGNVLFWFGILTGPSVLCSLYLIL